MRRLREKIIWIIVWISLVSNLSYSQSFGCPSIAYLFQGFPTSVYAVDLSSGNYILVAPSLVPRGQLNAIGFYRSDGVIWGFNMTNDQLVKINSSWEVTSYTVSGLPKNLYVGDVDNRGIYHLFRNNTLYKVDVSSGVPTTVSSIACRAGNIHDIAYNPADGNFYTIEGGRSILKRINPNTGNVTKLGLAPQMKSNRGAYGAVFFDPSGDFYVSNNRNGHIYRIRDVEDLSAGSSFDATLFAYGPSSSNNDGAKCSGSEIISEGCANFVDDDGDSLVDCDDPNCDNNLVCSVSGAFGGGLESNSFLGDKIALRDYNRSQLGLQNLDKSYFSTITRPGNYGNAKTGLFKNNYSIKDFMPIDILPNTETLETTPSDLVGLSNASEVSSVDIYSGSRRLGAVLGLKSLGGVYEHSKYICDRVKGSRVWRISKEKLDEENEFMMTIFRNRAGGVEYGTLFSVYLNEENDFVLESHWSTYTYPKDKEYFNFQIWSNSKSSLKMLVQETLLLIEAQAPIVAFNSSEAPEVYVYEQKYENGKVMLDVINNTGTKNITLSAQIRDTETSNPKNSIFEIALNGNPRDTVVLDLNGLYTLGGTIEYEEGKPLDQIFVGKGAWGLSYDKEGVLVKDFEVSKSSYEKYDPEAILIERNVHLKGEIKDEISIFRTIRSAAIPENLSYFNTLAFEVEGSGTLEIVLTKAGIQNYKEQPSKTIEIGGLCKEVFLTKGDFFQIDGKQEWDDIKSIAFIKRGNGENAEPFELKIGNVAFLNLTTIPDCGNYNQQSVKAYPNPMQSELNIVLSAGGFQDFEMVMTNQLGQVVGKGRGITNVDGSINFIRPGLDPGFYNYSVKVASGVYSGKVIVRY